MNNIQMAFCDKVNKEYFAERKHLCERIATVVPEFPIVVTQKDEVAFLELSKQLVTLDRVRSALLAACQRNVLTSNQLARLISVENVIMVVSRKWNTHKDILDKEVAEAAEDVAAEVESNRTNKEQERVGRVSLIK